MLASLRLSYSAALSVYLFGLSAKKQSLVCALLYLSAKQTRIHVLHPQAMSALLHKLCLADMMEMSKWMDPHHILEVVQDLTRHCVAGLPQGLTPFQVYSEYDESGRLRITVQNMALLHALHGDYFYGVVSVPAEKVAQAAKLPQGASIAHVPGRRRSPTVTVALTRTAAGLEYTLELATRAREITASIVQGAMPWLQSRTNAPNSADYREAVRLLEGLCDVHTVQLQGLLPPPSRGLPPGFGTAPPEAV